MRFRRPDTGSKEYLFAGAAGVLDGHAAVLEAEHAAGATLVVAPPEDTNALLPSVEVPGVRGDHEERAASSREIPAWLAGLALQGVRASAVMEQLGAGGESLGAAAGKRLAFVVHLICRSHTRQAASSRGSHDGYHAAAESGAFLMFASNVQEVADFSLIAHRVAELSLTPGVCAQDLYQTSHSVQNLHRVDDALALDYLGRSDDVIPCPVDAQAIVFGANRRRVPVLLDVDRPAGIGGVQESESHFRAIAAHRAFFSGHLASIMDDAMRAFGERTGRFYGRMSGYRTDDADVVVVGQGAVMEELIAVVDYLRSQKKVKAGLVNVTVLRPFASGALTHMLAGKRAVVVLDRTDSPLADSSPLFQEVRAAIDRATENGQSGDVAPYPDHATFRRIDDRPRLFSGIYGIGGDLPSFGELTGVFEHVVVKGSARRFFVGADFDTETRRFPHLETLQQRLAREYPALATLALKTPAVRLVRDGGAFELRSPSMQGGMFAGNLFAMALSDAMDWQVRTYPDGGLERNLQPIVLTTAYATHPGVTRSRPTEVGVTLVSGEHLLETLPVECPLERQGILVVGSVREPGALWHGLSRRAANWVRSGDFHVHVLDARKIATETAAHASFIDQLAIWSLIGAFARVSLTLDNGKMPRLLDALRARLEAAIGPDVATIDTIMKAFMRGGDEVKEVPWRTWSNVTHALGEPDAPWTVRGAAHADGSMFDPVRFWNSVGYLYDRGQSALTLADPYLATAVMPARSSAFRDLSGYRLRIPEWIPSACTGCADCWTQCPESALPSTIRSVSELLDAAARECERTGGALVQMKRMGDALAKQAYKLAQQQAPQPYESFVAILEDAFTRVVEKAGLGGDKLDALKQEFERLCRAVDRFPVAVTERFFVTPQESVAGTGRLLSIAINSLSCTACGVCIAACPESAIAWAEQTPERLARNRHDWDFLMQLPPLPGAVLADLVHADEPDTSVLRLLDTGVYHSLVGGDGSFPGNGAKTAVHLITAAIESEMRPRHAAHVARLSRLIERVEQRIQGTVDSTAKINDFEEFGQRLSRVAGGEITPDVLRGLAGDSDAARVVDAAKLARLTTLLHALKEQKRNYTEGDGRARLLLAIDPAPGAFWNGTYPYNPHPQPWASHLSGDAVALARGMCAGVMRRLGTELAVCRQVEAELEDRASTGNGAGSHADAPALSWAEFTADERRLMPVILVLADAANTDSASISAALDGPMPIRIALIDHEAITIEGGADGARRAVLSVLRASGVAKTFVLQAAIGHPGHLMHGVAESLKNEGPALYRVYAPDAVRDGLSADVIVDVARLAVEGRAVPLFIGHSDGDRLSLAGNPDADADWTFREMTVKEPSGADGRITTTVSVADWAARQARFRRHFTVLSKGNRSAQMKPLAEFLGLAPEAREGLRAYIDVVDREGRHAVAVVSAEMIGAAERAAQAWRELRDVAQGIKPPAVVAAPAATAAPAAPVSDAAAVQKLADNLLRLSGYGSDETFFKRRLREFVSQSGGPDGDAE